MKMRNVLIVAILSGVVFTSCRDNRGTMDDDIRIDRDRTTIDTRTDTRTDTDMRTGTDNNVSTRIQRNPNLTTFNEGMTRNQVTMNRGATTGTAAGTTGTRTATTGQGTTGTTTGQGTTGTTTGQGTTGTTTGQGTTGTTTGQGQIGQTTYTIFAPSNDAYDQLSDDQRNRMMDTQQRDRNTAAMNYLMVDQRLTENQLRQQIQNSNGTYNIRTMQGESLTATMDGNNIVLRDGAGNQARIVESDSDATDGVVHTIDRVLMPQDDSRNEAATRMGTGTTTGNTSGTRTGTGTTGTTTNRTGTNQ